MSWCLVTALALAKGLLLLLLQQCTCAFVYPCPWILICCVCGHICLCFWTCPCCLMLCLGHLLFDSDLQLFLHKQVQAGRQLPQSISTTNAEHDRKTAWEHASVEVSSRELTQVITDSHKKLQTVLYILPMLAHTPFCRLTSFAA